MRPKANRAHLDPDFRQDDISGPTAFVEKVGNAIRLVAVDPLALSLGIAPGVTLADARALVPKLTIFESDPGADHRLLERLADSCERWSPMVAIDPPDGLLIDITGCDHLFGGETKLVRDAETRFAQTGLHVRAALAYSPEAAHALARFQTLPAADEKAAVRRLPVAALECDEETLVALRRAGLKTIGDLAQRPQQALAARFGISLVTHLARMLGDTDSRLTPRRALPALVTERRFAEPIAHVETMLAVLGELASEAAATLEMRHAGGRHFLAHFFRCDGEVQEIAIETALPSRDPAVLARLFREKIDALADPLDPGFGFDLLRMCVARIEPLGMSQLQLEGGSVAESELAGLIDRLSIRLGRNRVRRFGPRDTHIPEQASFAFPAIDSAKPFAWSRPDPGEPPLRPLHLFGKPEQIEVVAEIPDGPPRRFRWRRALHEVTRFEGPERIAPLWWKLEPGEGLTRDYYRVEDMRGRRFWIFRYGLYGQERKNPGWYLHGLFA